MTSVHPKEPVLPRALSGAVPMDTYLDGVAKAVEAQGFTPRNSLAVISACRDELCQPVLAKITKRWGMPFNASGLGGMPALGPTGWGACLSNTPQGDGRRRLLVLAFPHVGVSEEGTPGMALHADQANPRPCCGALNKVHSALLKTPKGGTELSEDDHEVNRLLRILGADILEVPSDLVGMALVAAQSIDRVIWQDLEDIDELADADVAVFTAIQIHTGSSGDYALSHAKQIRPAGAPERSEL